VEVSAKAAIIELKCNPDSDNSSDYREFQAIFPLSTVLVSISSSAQVSEPSRAVLNASNYDNYSARGELLHFHPKRHSRDDFFRVVRPSRRGSGNGKFSKGRNETWHRCQQASKILTIGGLSRDCNYVARFVCSQALPASLSRR
jgi:hypothetical protein